MTPGLVAAAVNSLSQFTVEQQARLLVLRSFVQEARSGGGALSDDLAAAPDVRQPEPSPRGHGRRRPGSQQLLVVGGVLLMVIGLVGIVRTSFTMDDLQRNSLSAQAPLSPTAKFLPGVLVNPAKYLSAVNGGGGSSTGGGSNRVDQFYAADQLTQKQAMDRWEALLGIGLGLVLFANAMRAAAAAAASSDPEDETSVAVDFAPFVLVAAVLFAALSFFELP
ncbi:MAG: hypothetical protein JO057_18985 [Chloroflexi bacterium]|nr:hypothetical protein [Chloroflexota bacterium]